ncbi:MAG: hypothetical protein U0694_20825 [Anaerolineae bacterium]
MYDEKLARALNFSEAELAANRDGYMTLEQKNRIREVADEQVRFLGCVSGLLLVLSVFVLPIVLVTNGCALAFGVGVVLTTAAVGRLAYIRYHELKADMSKNDVLMTEGHVRLNQSSELAGDSGSLRLNGLKFMVSYQTLQALRNDDYLCVYYAPNTKRILSAESIQAQDEASPFDAALGRMLHFDAETLQANRGGTLTEAQRAAFWRQQAVELCGLGAVYAVTAALLVAAALWVLHGTGEPLVALTCLSVPLLVGAGGAFETFRNWKDARDDLGDGAVAVIEGTIRRPYFHSTRLRVGETLFYAAPAVYLTLRDGARYRVYYLPRTRRILSLERSTA